MKLYFKSSIANKADGWPMGFYGNSSSDGNDYCLDTHYLKSDEVPEVMMDAKTCSQLIAGLLNAYFSATDVSKTNEDKVLRMGTYIEEDDTNDNNPLQIDLPF